MTTKKPRACRTPSRDREEYTLTASDLKAMTQAAETIWDMICYYSNMPENRTGELAIKGQNAERYERLSELLDDIKNEIDWVKWTD